MVEQIGETFWRVGVHEHEELVQKHESESITRTEGHQPDAETTQPAVCVIILNLLNAVQAANIPVLDESDLPKAMWRFEHNLMACVSVVMIIMAVCTVLPLRIESVQEEEEQQQQGAQVSPGTQVGLGAQAGQVQCSPQPVEMQVSDSQKSVVQYMYMVGWDKLATCVIIFTMSVKLLVSRCFKYL